MLRALPLIAALAFPPTVAPPDTGTGLATVDAYRGLGTWVDIYSGRTLAHPSGAAARMKAEGVKTLYLQTSNWRQRADVVRSAFVARGLAVDKVVTIGRGKRELAVQTADGVAEPRNRRVEILVR